MIINKYLVVSIFLFAVSCKKETSKTITNNINSDTSRATKKENADSFDKVNGFVKESFVISCGSGCAISYSPESIKQINNSMDVTFNVKMYEDEKITDTYDEAYIFSYNDFGKLDKIVKKGESEDFLGTLMPDAQQSFLDFGNNLMANKGIIFSKGKKQNNSSDEKEYSICKLPFNFDDFYNICYDNSEKCSERYPSYTLPKNKDILDYYSIDRSPTSFFLLPKLNNIQPIICAYTDADIEGYELITAEKGKLISSLKIAKMDGESIQDFNITKEYLIILHKAKNADDSKKEIGRYKISDNGNIIKL